MIVTYMEPRDNQAPVNDWKPEIELKKYQRYTLSLGSI